MTNTQCTAVDCNEPGRESPFGTFSLILCEDHIYELSTYGKRVGRRIARTLDDLNPEMKHTPGWVYVIRLASGNVKIGFTAQDGMERLVKLSNAIDGGIPVQVLAIMRGGESLEMATHDRWFHLRVPGKSEQFYPDPSLLQWASQQGIDPEANQGAFTGWQERKHKRGTATDELTKELRELIKQGEQDNWF
ncbi:hypothetical protein ACIBW9_01785 [Streptomyces sp. NPDC049541]|uniref:hypothetical protein n=1 Tax=Streptomyces sp. NPDC049541 TaxID=3365594 RepID=UPI00378AF551